MIQTSHPLVESSKRVVDKHVSYCDMSDAMMNNICFNTSDQSTLNIIDPDFPC